MKDETLEAFPKFDELWNYQDPQGTEARFRDLLARTERAERPDYTVELLTQIARCQGLYDDFDNAHKTLDQAEKQLGAGMDRARVRCLLERGRVFNSGGEPARALPLFEQAWQLGKVAGETRLAFDALHMVALAQPTESGKVQWNLKGIAEVEGAPSEGGWLPAFYNNLGEAYASQGAYVEGLAAFQKLNALTTAKGEPADIYTQKDIARMLRALGRAEEALAMIRPIHDDLEAKKRPDGWIDEEMAECLAATGCEAEARPLFGRAYEALKGDLWVVRNDAGKLERLRNMTGGGT